MRNKNEEEKKLALPVSQFFGSYLTGRPEIMEPTIPNRTDQEKPSHSPGLLANISHLDGVQINIDHEVREGNQISFWSRKGNNP